MRMRHIVTCGLSGSTIIFHISHKSHDFRKKKVIENKIPVPVFSRTFFSGPFLILRGIQRDVIKNRIGLYDVKYPLFLSNFKESLIFSTVFRKIIKYQIS